MTGYQKRQKQEFVLALARFMVDLQAGKSIALGLPQGVIPWAKEWANVRNTTPIGGYSTREEAIEALSEWLGIDMNQTDIKTDITASETGSGEAPKRA